MRDRELSFTQRTCNFAGSSYGLSSITKSLETLLSIFPKRTFQVHVRFIEQRRYGSWEYAACINAFSQLTTPPCNLSGHIRQENLSYRVGLEIAALVHKCYECGAPLNFRTPPYRR